MKLIALLVSLWLSPTPSGYTACEHAWELSVARLRAQYVRGEMSLDRFLWLYDSAWNEYMNCLGLDGRD